MIYEKHSVQSNLDLSPISFVSGPLLRVRVVPAFVRVERLGADAVAVSSAMSARNRRATSAAYSAGSAEW